ncbi:hypothetical protein JJQ59_35045 (plasmid) [Cupriavidus necator]|uniref:hypothetical protein n=1 Tax=Cupriavidus necator TaxID=106590 RepID=UPI0011BF965E|nr:hypothetical protein [Cupriavidus necator]QQX89741.1 hypothetical protein JJQ59_35045 [Cupriavidus necator]
MPRKLTEAEILISFRRAHGARYDYSLVRYSGASRHVRVICRFHGPFTVTPHHRKNGVGCRKCYFERRRAGIDYFIEVATRAHAGRYDYSRVPQNLKLNDEVLIHCLQHDRLFLQVARAHVDGHTGCRACLSNKLKGSPELRGQYKDENLPLKNFIERAVKLHGAIYDYSRFVYHGVGVKGEIICSEHGPFYQTPSNHLRGTKCPDCARLLQHKNSFKEKCRSLGVNYWRALKRREAQMSEEKIFDDAFLRSERVVNPLCVHGINYPNMEAAVRALDPIHPR